jgi:hypothetical protein
MNNKIVSIHQPNFFPWLGFFDKIYQSDVFIFLDDVQFPKKGGTWTNRVKLSVSGDGRWVTSVINRNYHGMRSILEMEFQAGNPWREKMIKTIEQNYSKLPYFDSSIEIFEELINNPINNIAEYNIHAIKVILKELDLCSTELFRSSEIDHIGESNELLCSLTKAVKGNVYMCGGGAEGYQDEQIFKNQEVILKYQNFEHPFYIQKGKETFIAGLSIIDAVMNCGWNGVGKLLKSKDG